MVKHQTVATGDDIYAKYQQDHVASVTGAGTEYIEKATESSALDSAGLVATVNWTDLDLTAHTSATANKAYLRLTLQATVIGTGGSCCLLVRSNGKTTPFFSKTIDKAGITANESQENYVFCGMDTGQVIEYEVLVGTGWTVRALIDVLGYYE